MKTYTATVILTASRNVTLTFPDDAIIQDIREAFSLEGCPIYWGDWKAGLVEAGRGQKRKRKKDSGQFLGHKLLDRIVVLGLGW